MILVGVWPPPWATGLEKLLSLAIVFILVSTASCAVLFARPRGGTRFRCPSIRGAPGLLGSTGRSSSAPSSSSRGFPRRLGVLIGTWGLSRVCLSARYSATA